MVIIFCDLCSIKIKDISDDDEYVCFSIGDTDPALKELVVHGYGNCLEQSNMCLCKDCVDHLRSYFVKDTRDEIAQEVFNGNL
jgi:hypothetical protein